MPVIYRKLITRKMIEENPDWLFVFGDNYHRSGYGGQAATMRGYPNSVGIATKRYPSMTEHSFLTEDDFSEWCDFSKNDLNRLLEHTKSGGIIVWPEDGIGTGLAQLSSRAPKIFNFIENFHKNVLTYF